MLDDHLLQLAERRLLFGDQPQQLASIEHRAFARAAGSAWRYSSAARRASCRAPTPPTVVTRSIHSLLPVVSSWASLPVATRNAPSRSTVVG